MKKPAFISLIIIGMISLLFLMSNSYLEIQKSGSSITINQISLLKMSLWGFLFGVLIEWKALYNLINGHIKVNFKLLIPAIILTVIIFIPRIYWVQWYGLGRPFYIEMLWKPEIQMLLTVFSGILLIRSLGEKE